MSEEQKPIQRRKRPDTLTKLVKQLDKLAPAALKRLGELCDSKDERVALEACKTIPKMLAEFKEQAEKRDLMLLGAQKKLGAIAQTEEEDDEEEDDTPILQFDVIKDVN